MSPKLFNAVLEFVCKHLARKWEAEGGGIRLAERRISNLRLADEVLLVFSSGGMLENMMADLAREAGEVRLQLHYGGQQCWSTSLPANVMDGRR